MKWLVALFLCLGTAQAQVVQHQISDDGYVRVPLQFPFPYYGRVFTESFMFSNGVVGFLNPTNHFCCSGYDITQPNHPFSFAIMPLQTDLLNYNGRFLTEGTAQYQRYKWENISEYGSPQNLNTFGVEIRPSGYISMMYEKVNINPWRPVTIGMTGDSSKNEYTLHYHGAGFSSTENVAYITQFTGDLCLVDVLSSPNCPGYAAAYLTQQCSISALYSPSCAGYEQAYTAQQCSINPLYSPSCPGYEIAYHDQQCALSPLYATTCTGYAEAYRLQQCGLNPLYSTTCQGYAQAYFNEQCRLNGLYDRQCPNYSTAYATQQVTTAPSVVVSAPTVQVSTTGTVAVETPVVSDPVVNEVITRPVNATVSVQTTSPQPVAQTAQAEPKAEKKTETKQVSKPTRAEVKNEVSEIGTTITQPVHEYKAPIILDLAYQKMIKKPIPDNNRAMYNLIMNSQLKHEEMVDGQYRRERDRDIR
jgi:hypothetical protein